MIVNSLNKLIEALEEKLPINKVFISTAKKDRRIDREEGILGTGKGNCDKQ